LRRAISTAYYAMFHALSTSNADLIAGQDTGQPIRLDHNLPLPQALPCREPTLRLATSLQPTNPTLAVAIAGIKRQRENADYNPSVTFGQNQVITWIDRSHRTIIDFNSASPHAGSMATAATLADQQ